MVQLKALSIPLLITSTLLLIFFNLNPIISTSVWMSVLLITIWQRHRITDHVSLTFGTVLIIVLFLFSQLWYVSRYILLLSIIGFTAALLLSAYFIDCFMKYPRKYLTK